MKNTDSDNSREWAAQAYALLKKRQEEQKQELQKLEEQKQELQKNKTRTTEGRRTKQELQKVEEQNKIREIALVHKTFLNQSKLLTRLN